MGQSTAVGPGQGCGQYATGHSEGARLGPTLKSLPGSIGKVSESTTGPQCRQEAGKHRWKRKPRWSGECSGAPGSQPRARYLHERIPKQAVGEALGRTRSMRGERACTRVSGQCWDLELQARLGDSSEGSGLPVGLLGLLPHDHIEAAAVLVAEEKACIVVIGDRVHVEGAFKVHTIESCIAWRS